MKYFSKISLAFVFFCAVIFLAGCGRAKKESQNSSAPVEEKQSVAEKMKESLFDLVTKGAGMKCTIDDPQSGQLTIYTKGDKAKAEGFPYMSQSTDANQFSKSGESKMENGSMINDGVWVYMWSRTEGMKFNIKEMEELTPKDQAQDKEQTQSKASDWKDWIKGMDDKGVKYDCSPAVLSDADFVPPSDVKFEDWGKKMKELMQKTQEMQKQLPQNIPNQPMNIPTP